jgi:purine-nucleoside phosphorylase
MNARPPVAAKADHCGAKERPTSTDRSLQERIPSHPGVTPAPSHWNESLVTENPFSAAASSAKHLAQRTGQPTHDVAVILGSGWAPAADALGATGPPATTGPPLAAESTGSPSVQVPLADLGGFARPTVAGHVPAVRSIGVGRLRALVFLGRTHLYEGLPVASVVHGVRTAVAAGCRVIVLTNAAGGIRAGFRVGQPVLISDPLNLTGRSPLTGEPPPDGYPSRFTDLTDLYSRRLRAVALEADPSLAEGVYAALPGPHYETPAEIRMLAAAGADLVGMSTALEAIAARHLGAEVLAISLVTNPAAGLAPTGQLPQGLDHADVVAAGMAATARMGALLAAILPRVMSAGG